MTALACPLIQHGVSACNPAGYRSSFVMMSLTRFVGGGTWKRSKFAACMEGWNSLEDTLSLLCSKPNFTATAHKHGILRCDVTCVGGRLRVVSWPQSDGEITTPTPLTGAWPQPTTPLPYLLASSVVMYPILYSAPQVSQGSVPCN